MAESIYNWTEVHQHPPPKPTMYHSKHDGSTNPNNSLLDPFSVTSTYGSIGRDLTEKESPNDFLRSGSLSRPATLPSPSKLREFANPIANYSSIWIQAMIAGRTQGSKRVLSFRFFCL